MPYEEARSVDPTVQSLDHASSSETPPTETGLLAIICSDSQSNAWKAFEDLMQPYIPQLVAFAGSLLSGRNDLVQDAYQDMARKVWNRLRGRSFVLDPGKTFGAYLHSAIRNAAQTIIQSEQRERGGPFSLSLDQLHAERPWEQQDVTGPDDPVSQDHPHAREFDASALELLSPQILESPSFGTYFSALPLDMMATVGTASQYDYVRLRHSPLLRAISRLRQPRRDCFLLARVWELEHAAIASLLGLTPQQVADHNFQAKAQLKMMLSYLLREEDGFSIYQIAAKLRIPANQVQSHIDRGRQLYTQTS